MPPQNVFTGGTLDRIGDRRRDEAFVRTCLENPSTVLLPLRAGRVPVRQATRGYEAAPLAASAFPGFADRPWALLGLQPDGTAHIAVDLGEGDDADPPLSDGASFEDLRQVATRIDAPSASAFATARGLLHWRRVTKHCARCGAACEPAEAGWVMRCTACATSHFPRTDPAVIMLVTNGDRALLARNARYEGRRMFSTLAGFVEPGESLEEAVAREVREECGVGVARVEYHSSQPWPFPASIMLGFTAETTDDAITIDGEEIVEASWFTRDELARAASLDFELPPRTSIARRMIDDWISEE